MNAIHKYKLSIDRLSKSEFLSLQLKSHFSSGRK
jgi:hypothetical protein